MEICQMMEQKGDKADNLLGEFPLRIQLMAPTPTKWAENTLNGTISNLVGHF